MNVKNEKRKVSLVNSEKPIKYISKDNKIFEKSTRKNCFLVFSLSFGSYQEEFLKKALKDPEILRTARLIKKKDDYFLSISIIEKFEQSIETLNYMGISRGIDCAVSYTVVDLNGNKLFENFIDSEKIPVQDCEINRIANTLLKISREHKCQVIMENLQNSRDRLTYTDKDGKIFYPALSINLYNKLLSVLDSKVKNAGLPGIIKVSGRNIFYSCTSCGNISKLNRFSENIMICTKCGTYNTVEKSGSLNLSRKLIKYSSDKILINVEETKAGIKFTNEELGFDFFTKNPLNCIDEFYTEIDKLIKEFYENITVESKSRSFLKKYSMIKKIEKNKKIFELKK
jgi:putative transposase